MARFARMPTDAQIIAKHNEGYHARKMAMAFKCSREFLRKRIRALGLIPILENQEPKLDAMHPMWSNDENSRRQAIYERQRRGAAQTLREMNDA